MALQSSLCNTNNKRKTYLSGAQPRSHGYHLSILQHQRISRSASSDVWQNAVYSADNDPLRWTQEPDFSVLLHNIRSTMPSLTVSSLSQSLILLVLSQRSYAQDSSQCAAIASQVQYNASSTLTIPALSLSYLGSDPSNVLIRNETSFSWTLSSYIQPRDNGANSNPNITETVVWLDTAESDAERLGETMRMCHNFVSLQTGPNLTWSHDVLEKSVGDTGDCRSMVSEACLQALERQYTNNAASERNEYSRCTDTNTTVPWECAGSGMVAPISRRKSFPLPFPFVFVSSFEQQW